MNTFQSIGYMGSDYVGTGYVSTAAVVQLPAPRNQYKTKTAKSQSSARTLGGAFYVYDRSVITRTYTAAFPKVTAAVLAQLVAFLDNDAAGYQVPFIWVDHLNISRTVKLQGSINIVPTSNLFFTITVTLVEQFTDEAIFRDWPYMGTDYVGTGYVTT